MNSRKARSHRPFLSLEGAAFRFGDSLVFEDTTWVFHRGEHWAILGQNGSGKSLLAEAVLRRLPLVHGALRYHFRPPAQFTVEESIGHVSFEERKASAGQCVTQGRWNSLEEERRTSVDTFLSYDRVMNVNPFELTDRHTKFRPRFEQRRRRAIRLLGITPFLPRGLISLSNGERQRVELARTLCLPLRLLILDEPLAGLDEATRAAFGCILKSLMGTALRVLLIATRLDDVPEEVTHLMVVNRCRVVAAGPRQAVQSMPRVRRLLASSTVGLDAPLLGKRPRAAREGRPFRHTSRTREGTRFGLHLGEARRESLELARSELVRIREGTVRYGNATILSGVNWTIVEGESWALLGPNGSGKTTLLSLIVGDNPQAYQNDVAIFGKKRGSGESIWEIKERIGWVSPELHLCYDGQASCFEVVASGFHETVGLFEEPMERQKAAARRRLAQFQLLEFAQVPLSALSSGHQRMVLLARALVKNPPLLILDEPCQGLDPIHRNAFVNAVETLIRNRATTVVFVTHRQEEIPPSIKRVLRLAAGQVAVDPV